jgi:hypothetical protein
MSLLRVSEGPIKEFDVVRGQLPEQAVREFTQLYEQIFGIKLERDEAALRARNFLTLYAAVLGEP